MVGGGISSNAIRSVALGCGGYLPAKVVTNHDLHLLVDTSDEWIRQRTGIRERHFVENGELTSDLATHAARAALVDARSTRRGDGPKPSCCAARSITREIIIGSSRERPSATWRTAVRTSLPLTCLSAYPAAPATIASNKASSSSNEVSIKQAIAG